MQIHLKQVEIEVALKAFIASKGISLQGKLVTVEFTAGRKETGISAELTIEDDIVPPAKDTVYIRGSNPSSAMYGDTNGVAGVADSARAQPDAHVGIAQSSQPMETDSVDSKDDLKEKPAVSSPGLTTTSLFNS